MSVNTVPNKLFLKIAVPIDQSEPSKKALAFARMLAKHFGSHLELLHITRTRHSVYIPQGGWIPDRDVDRDTQYLSAVCALMKAEGIAAELIDEEGSLPCDIIEFIERSKPDLVVMGTHGRQSAARLFVGSIAEMAIRNVHAPVLTIGPHVRAEAARHWAPRKILCVSSPSPSGVRLASYAKGIADGLGATVHLLTMDGWSPGGDKEAGLRRFWLELEQLLPGWSPKAIDIKTAAEENSQNIIRAAEEVGADLIVMGAHEGGALATHLSPGLVPRTLMVARCPVLTMHEK
ncbi:universal stress protein [Silvibacterium acidisoli]|uniref:universal stress protein n=1 Tax=Acidobacteriaceae bacterium ZG23-2 TaxID=2883246 RepID=UPI00406D2340